MDGTRYMYNRMGDLVMTDRERTLGARRNADSLFESGRLSFAERSLEADSRCTDNTRNLGRRLVRALYVLLLTHRNVITHSFAK